MIIEKIKKVKHKGDLNNNETSARFK